MATVLTAQDVDEILAARALAWSREGDVLVKEVDRGDFRAALDYVNRVGGLSEAADHHPDIEIRWRTVVLRLSTHSAGGITERDLVLASQIDGLDELP